MSVERLPLLNAVREIFTFPLSVPGWMLVSAECSASGSRCLRRWARRGGTFDDLRRAFPEDDLDTASASEANVRSLDVAVTSRHWDFPRHTLGDERHPLRQTELELRASASLLQAWRTAGIVLDFKTATPWPRLPDLPGAFRQRGAVVAGEVAMRDVPGPFILEALGESPDFISWESVKVDVEHVAEAAGTLRFSASGVFYGLQ
jgi:hypothetical protein